MNGEEQEPTVPVSQQMREKQLESFAGIARAIREGDEKCCALLDRVAELLTASNCLMQNQAEHVTAINVKLHAIESVHERVSELLDRIREQMILPQAPGQGQQGVDQGEIARPGAGPEPPTVAPEQPDKITNDAGSGIAPEES